MLRTLLFVSILLIFAQSEIIPAKNTTQTSNPNAGDILGRFFFALAIIICVLIVIGFILFILYKKYQNYLHVGWWCWQNGLLDV